MSDVPKWVIDDCRLWGQQKRRIWEGHDWHGNIDGYAQSLLGRIREERDGASQGVATQHWPEVYWGGGLDVHRALRGMQERQLYVLHFQYVWNPDWGVSAARKAACMSIGRTEYFELVGKAETWVHARLEQLINPDAQLVEKVHEIVQRALQNGRAPDKKAHPGIDARANLAALHRPKLSLSR